MNTSTFKRILTGLLASVMLLSITACGAPAESSSSKADSSSTASESEGSAEESEGGETAEDGPLTPYAEPIEISWGIPTSPVQQFFEGDTWEDNVWTRKIKEELNIDVTIGFSADTSTDAYVNKVNTLLASGDFPDIIKYNDRSFFKQAQEAGYLADLTAVFDEYATPELKAYQEAYPDSFNGATIDDKLYAFPYMVDNFHQAINLWIRGDWLASTNSEPPTTVEEMVELARKFTFEDPDGDGIDDTYGLGLTDNVVRGNYGSVLGVLSAYGIPAKDGTGIFYHDENGDVTFSYLQPEMKDALEVLSGMYADGLIDKEFIVTDLPAMETDIIDGSVGMMYHENWGTWHPFNLPYQDSGVIYHPYSIPTVEGITPQIGIQSNETGDLFMVSSNTEHPEAAIKILNLYEATAISSDDPEDFQKYWAFEQYRFCPIFIGVPTELYAPVIHEALEAGSADGLSGTALEYYNYVIGFEDGSLADDTNAFGSWGQLRIGGSMDIDLAHKENGELVINLMANDLPEIWQQNQGALETMVETMMIDIITGQQPLEYHDQFVTEWLNAGGQETLDEMNKMYSLNN